MSSATLRTLRLRLEPFEECHLDGLHAMNSLPEVTRYIGGTTETREQTAAVISRVKRCWAAWGTSWWAFIETKSERVAGAGCVQYLRRDAAPPADLESLKSNPIEIGWRLHPDFWRQGLASEAARCMAAFAFDRFPIQELLAVRHPENVDSARVMERLGMRQRGLEPWYGTTVATHVISRDEWQRRVSLPSNFGVHGSSPFARRTSGRTCCKVCLDPVDEGQMADFKGNRSGLKKAVGHTSEHR